MRSWEGGVREARGVRGVRGVRVTVAVVDILELRYGRVRSSVSRLFGRRVCRIFYVFWTKKQFLYVLHGNCEEGKLLEPGVRIFGEAIAQRAARGPFRSSKLQAQDELALLCQPDHDPFKCANWSPEKLLTVELLFSKRYSRSIGLAKRALIEIVADIVH